MANIVNENEIFVFVEEDDFVFIDDPTEENSVAVNDIIITVEGPQGAPGRDGEDGEDGERGLSAYELAVRDQGFVGTELQWLESLKGQDGEDLNAPTKTEFIQNIPSDTWVISHSYAYRPTVVILDNNGDEVFADVSYPNPSTIVIEFAHEMTGMVQLG